MRERHFFTGEQSTPWTRRCRWRSERASDKADSNSEGPVCWLLNALTWTRDRPGCATSPCSRRWPGCISGRLPRAPALKFQLTLIFVAQKLELELVFACQSMYACIHPQARERGGLARYIRSAPHVLSLIRERWYERHTILPPPPVPDPEIRCHNSAIRKLITHHVTSCRCGFTVLHGGRHVYRCATYNMRYGHHATEGAEQALNAVRAWWSRWHQLERDQLSRQVKRGGWGGGGRKRRRVNNNKA